MNISLKKAALSVLIPAMLWGCSTSPHNGDVTEQQIKHHKWQLFSINNKVLTTEDYENVPYIDIGEKLTITGHAGCNNYFGQGVLTDGKFSVAKMGSTMKMCLPQAIQTEDLMKQTLSAPSDISLSKDELTLQGENNTLVFKLKDWVY